VGLHKMQDQKNHFFGFIYKTKRIAWFCVGHKKMSSCKFSQGTKRQVQIEHWMELIKVCLTSHGMENIKSPLTKSNP
jgi:hypothetical protein